MKNIWKWIVGALITLVFLFALPYFLRIFPACGGMMGGSAAWRHP